MLSSFATFHFLNTFYRTITYWQRYFYLFRSSIEKIEARGEQDSFLPIFQDIQKLRQPLCHSRVYNIYFDSYIKPQQKMVLLLELCVVYLLIPTSNHNLVFCNTICIELYIFWFLHQTTTIRCIGLQVPRCISFDSYIKPQLILWCLSLRLVVYLLIPTSNHNLACCCLFHVLLYIFWFLHQTTTCIILTLQIWRCISFDSYIKPQLLLNLNFSLSVVYLLIPTSNHNVEDGLTRQEKVVYLLIPTSNHNRGCSYQEQDLLYIFWFLHQTTTKGLYLNSVICCISFDSYIKPQL